MALINSNAIEFNIALSIAKSLFEEENIVNLGTVKSNFQPLYKATREC